MSAAEEVPLPPDWSKHWSNTWKKHYWFNSKTGKQSWEPPAAEVQEEGGGSSSKVGEKRKLEAAADTPKQAEKKPEKPQASPVKAKPAGNANPAGKANASTLDSILGSIGNVSATQSKAALEAKRRRKEVNPAPSNACTKTPLRAAAWPKRTASTDAEESRRAEEKAERENYTQWVQGAIETFLEGGDEFYECPPSSSVHRLIIKDEAEEKGLVALSHGEDEADKRVYLFRPETAPNHLEQRYLHMGGTIEGLMERRARGDTFKEYNTVFSLNDAKPARAKPRPSKKGAQDDAEDEMESRVVQERTADANSVAEIAQKIRENRNI